MGVLFFVGVYLFDTRPPYGPMGQFGLVVFTHK